MSEVDPFEQQRIYYKKVRLPIRRILGNANFVTLFLHSDSRIRSKA